MTLLVVYPDCEAARRELCRTEKRLGEQDYGLSNFLLMHEAAAGKAYPRLDIAINRLEKISALLAMLVGRLGISEKLPMLLRGRSGASVLR